MFSYNLTVCLSLLSIISVVTAQADIPCPACDAQGIATVTFPNTLRNIPRDVLLSVPPFHPIIFFEQDNAFFVEPTDPTTTTLTENQKQLTLLTLPDRTIAASTRSRNGGIWFRQGNRPGIEDDEPDHLEVEPQLQTSPNQVCCRNDERIIWMTATLDATVAAFSSSAGSLSVTIDDGNVLWDSTGSGESSWLLFPETTFTDSEIAVLSVNTLVTVLSARRRRQAVSSVRLFAFNDNLITGNINVNSGGGGGDPVCGPLQGGTGVGGGGGTGTGPAPGGSLQSQTIVRVHNFNVIHSPDNARPREAVVIENEATGEFLAVNIDDNWNIAFDAERTIDFTFQGEVALEVSLPVSSLRFAPASDFDASIETLGNNLTYFQNTDIEKMRSPDQRFFTKHSLISSNPNEFLLCSLHHREACIFSTGSELVLVSVKDMTNPQGPQGAPDFFDIPQLELGFLQDSLQQLSGVGTLAQFNIITDVETVFPPGPVWAGCSQNGNFYSPVPGTGCKSFTQSTLALGLAGTHNCPETTAFDTSVCVCNHDPVPCPCP